MGAARESELADRIEEPAASARPTHGNLPSSFRMKHPSRHPLGFVALTGALALVAVGAGLAGVGCTTVATSSGSEDAAVFVTTEAGVSACQTCVADECTAAWALCLTNESCLSVRDCARTGSGLDCTCNGANDAGLRGGDLYRAFTTCNDARTCATGCASDCASTCASPPATTPAPCEVPDASASDLDAGADAADDASADAGETPSPPGPSADRCASCAAAKCDSAKKACAIGSECAVFLECAFACADSTCVYGCGRLHATGQVAAVELATCAQAGCEAECGL